MRNSKYPLLPLLTSKGNNLKKAQSDKDLVVEESHEDMMSKDVPAEENQNPTNPACSLDRVSETDDSQATFSSVNLEIGCDKSTATMTESIPSEISNSQTSAREPQVKHLNPQTKYG